MQRVLFRVFAGVAFTGMLVSASQAKVVLYYSFDDVKGDAVKDLSGMSNDGVLEGGPKVVDGQSRKALEFSSSRVKVLASKSLSGELFAEGMFTLSLWIRAARQGNTWQQIFRAGSAPNDTLFINDDGRLSWRGWVGGGWAGGMCETAADVVEANKWTHAGVVSDKKNFRVYVNGKLSKESGFQQTRGANAEYVIGGYAGGESYTGAVDEIVIFDEPLSEATLNTIISKGMGTYLAVEPKGRLATRWAALRANR
jgi:hypothetical protein